MLNEKMRNAITGMAMERKIRPACLLAVCDVESGGRVFASVNGVDEPLIRFEGHYFYRLLNAARRNQAVVQGLANRRAGKIANPRTQKGRWNLLNKACLIDRDAALQSCSWGLGQVMGAHWRWLDYASIDDLVAKVRLGLEGQVELMLRFIEKSDLVGAMQEEDWRVFARTYNGPAYGKNNYDRKLAAAFEKYAVLLGEKQPARRLGRNGPLIIKYGDRGDMVRDLQLKLQSLGIAIAGDGDFGPATLRAVRFIQKEYGLVVDGVVGKNTFEALERVVAK